MNNFYTAIILNLFILIPACIGIVRFRRIDKAFLPFLLLLWVGSVNDVLSLLLAYTVKTSLVNSNVYVLIEYILVLWQFYNWNYSSAKPYILFIAAGIITWVADNLLLHSILHRNAVFRIFYSFVIIFYSIDQVNKLIAYETRPLLKNTVFLTCLSFLVYYSCKAYVEVFIAFSPGFNDVFNEKVIMLLIFSNFFSNILYTIVVLCIPPKLEFTLPY